MTGKSASRPRVGILGGTFNPVHLCHTTVAEQCRLALGLDRIRFIPAGTPPHKRSLLAPAEHRLAMVRLATAGNPAFEVSDLEVHRRGPSFTADTLRALRAAEPAVAWTLVVGLDAVLGLATWHQPDQVLRLAPLAIPFRPGADFTELMHMPLLAGVDFEPLQTDLHHAPVTVRGDGIRLTLLPIPPCPHSATAIRAAIRAGQHPVPGLSEAVANYIIEHHLYV